MFSFFKEEWVCHNCRYVHTGKVDKLSNQECPNCRTEYPGWASINNPGYCPRCNNNMEGKKFLTRGCSCGYKAYSVQQMYDEVWFP